eukprot:SAG22_NODE_279_length_13134_cov_7.532561_2_plen_273_part_00
MAGAAATKLHAAVEEVWKSFKGEMDDERRKMREAQELWDEQKKAEESALEQKGTELAQQVSALEEEKSEMRSRVDVGQIVELNVGGQYFTTSSNTLQSKPDSMIGAMFSRWDLPKDKDGRFFIDRDPKFFAQILNFLRDKNYEFKVAEDEAHHFKQELEYFGLDWALLDSGDEAEDEPEPAPEPAPQPAPQPAMSNAVHQVCTEGSIQNSWKPQPYKTSSQATEFLQSLTGMDPSPYLAFSMEEIRLVDYIKNKNVNVAPAYAQAAQRLRGF